MSTGAVIGVTLIAIGFVVNVACLLRYSRFLDRVSRIDPRRAESLLMDGGEGGGKNASIAAFFLNGKYMDLPDPSLHKLGDSVRNAGLGGALFVVAGVFCLAVSP